MDMGLEVITELNSIHEGSHVELELPGTAKTRVASGTPLPMPSIT